MGKGDKRTAKGKRFSKSFGATRPRNPVRTKRRAAKAATPPKKA